MIVAWLRVPRVQFAARSSCVVDCSRARPVSIVLSVHSVPSVRIVDSALSAFSCSHCSHCNQLFPCVLSVYTCTHVLAVYPVFTLRPVLTVARSVNSCEQLLAVCSLVTVFTVCTSVNSVRMVCSLWVLCLGLVSVARV